MAKYSIKDFQIGDKVYHLSNPRLIMVAIEIHPEVNDISCRWVDKDGKVQCIEFKAEELGKTSDLGPRITAL